MITIPELTADAIRAAHDRIDPAFTHSPQYVHEGLSRRLGVPVIVKVETVNPIRSFKGRGTWVVVHALAGEGRIGPGRAVVAVSAGNFGQGIAYAARALGVPAVIFASRNANRGKVERMRALGATVTQVGEDFDEARGASEAYAAENDAELLVDGDDPRISTGAATLAVELTDAVAAGHLPSPVVMAVPVGNGALINGVGGWLRATSAGVPGRGDPGGGGVRDDPQLARRPADRHPDRRDLRGRHRLAHRDPGRRRPDGGSRRRHGPRIRGCDARGPGRADAELGITVEGAAAASWAGLLVGEPPTGPAVVIVTGSNV